METVIGQLFTGLSLGSILLLAALGLSLTFGQMGVINMAHGSFIMAGSYTAYTVQEYLISRGVGANRIRTVSYGKERPAATCSDESCFSQNRRVVTVVQPGAGT